MTCKISGRLATVGRSVSIIQNFTSILISSQEGPMPSNLYLHRKHWSKNGNPPTLVREQLEHSGSNWQDWWLLRFFGIQLIKTEESKYKLHICHLHNKFFRSFTMDCPSGMLQWYCWHCASSSFIVTVRPQSCSVTLLITTNANKLLSGEKI